MEIRDLRIRIVAGKPDLSRSKPPIILEEERPRYDLHNGELCIMRNGVPIPVVREWHPPIMPTEEHPPFDTND